MRGQDGGYRERAVDAVAAREYRTAGDEYTRAAWHVLAEPRAGKNPFAADDRGVVGVGLGLFVTGAVAYRVAGDAERARHRGVEGVAVARDLQTALSHPAQRACLDEFVADFRVVGDLDGAAAAYEDAASAYEAASEAIEEPRARSTTPLFEAATAPFQQVARGPANGEIAVTWEDLHGDDPARPGEFLAARPGYKAQRFPGLVERVAEDGRLAAPRGTTAYDSEHYRCPDCGSADVNWVADHELCLRCSTPMERT